MIPPHFMKSNLFAKLNYFVRLVQKWSIAKFKQKDDYNSKQTSIFLLLNLFKMLYLILNNKKKRYLAIFTIFLSTSLIESK